MLHHGYRCISLHITTKHVIVYSNVQSTAHDSYTGEWLHETNLQGHVARLLFRSSVDELLPAQHLRAEDAPVPHGPHQTKGLHGAADAGEQTACRRDDRAATTSHHALVTWRERWCRYYRYNNKYTHTHITITSKNTTSATSPHGQRSLLKSEQYIHKLLKSIQGVFCCTQFPDHSLHITSFVQNTFPNHNITVVANLSKLYVLNH